MQIFWYQASPDTPPPVETHSQEKRDSDNDSEQYPDDDIPEDEEDDDEDDDEEDPDEADYKASPLNFFIKRLFCDFELLVSESLLSVSDTQSPPTTQTQDKKDEDDEGTMPPYDQETQVLIDGKCVDEKEWLSLSSAMS